MVNKTDEDKDVSLLQQDETMKLLRAESDALEQVLVSVHTAAVKRAMELLNVDCNNFDRVSLMVLALAEITAENLMYNVIQNIVPNAEQRMTETVVSSMFPNNSKTTIN